MDKKKIIKKVEEIKNKEQSPSEKPVKVNMNFKDFVKKLIRTKKKK